MLRNLRTNEKTIFLAALLIVAVFVFRHQIVSFMSQLYYEDSSFSSNSQVGLRFVFILSIAVIGFLLRGTLERDSQILLHLMIIAAMFQMFSGFDNIFTRLADYYFQFSILYIPLFFAHLPIKSGWLISDGVVPLFGFDERSRSITIIAMVMVLVFFYYITGISAAGKFISVDDYWTYRSLWSH